MEELRTQLIAHNGSVQRLDLPQESQGSVCGVQGVSFTGLGFKVERAWSLGFGGLGFGVWASGVTISVSVHGSLEGLYWL